MKKIIFAFSILAISTVSCRKIIDIEQEEGDKRTVIEATLLEGTHSFDVKVSKTSNFFGDNTPVPITNATVVLSDGAGDYTLTSFGDGNYQLVGFNAVSGTEYTLTVNENGNSFVAKGIMPAVVPIDTISYEFVEASTFNDSGYITQIEFNDPAATDNYYRIEVDIQGTYYGDIFNLILLDDGFLNGNRIEFPLFAIDVADAFDNVTMKLTSCDRATFTYLEGVDALINTGNGAPPANPTGNFNNGALGNFSLYASDTQSIVILP
jgi:hypothetical protein